MSGRGGAISGPFETPATPRVTPFPGSHRYIGLQILQRLLLTCFALLLDSRYNRILFVLCVLLMSTVTERELTPFLNPSLNRLVYFFHQQVMRGWLEEGVSAGGVTGSSRVYR